MHVLQAVRDTSKKDHKSSVDVAGVHYQKKNGTTTDETTIW